MGRDLINAVVARWLDGKCQRLLATALKVQHCWTLKTTVGDCWRQSPTCAGDSRQLKYKHTHDCRRLSPSRATVGDCRRLKYKPGFRVAHCSRSQDIDLFKCPWSYFNTPLRNTCLVAFAVLGQLNQDTFPITCFSIWTRSPIGCLINVQNSCIPTTMNEISHYIFVGSIWPLWRSSSKYVKQSWTT